MKRHTIRHHREETDCAWCGWPLDVGDVATIGADSELFCSEVCAKKELPKYHDDPSQSYNYVGGAG